MGTQDDAAFVAAARRHAARSGPVGPPRGVRGDRASRRRTSSAGRRPGAAAWAIRIGSWRSRRGGRWSGCRSTSGRTRCLRPRRRGRFCRAATGLLAAAPSKEVAQAILDALRDDAPRQHRPGRPQRRARRSDAEFRDTLRVIQLALIRGKIAPADVPDHSRRSARRISDARRDDESRAGEAAGVLAAAGGGDGARRSSSKSNIPRRRKAAHRGVCGAAQDRLEHRPRS